MPRVLIVLKVLAILFFVSAVAAVWDGIATVLANREARFSGREITQTQFFSAARNLAFIWLFAAIYGAIGVGLWQRRKLRFILVLLLAILVGQWLNVGYPYPFVLAFLTLGFLAVPAIRGRFRN